MGWFWKKKKKPVVEQTCRHKYKDFPWLVDAIYHEDKRRVDVKIIEPFVCVHCKERINRTLQELNRTNITFDRASDFVNSIREKYKEHIADAPIIEDMIADMQLVDREYLDLIESLAHPQDPLGEILKKVEVNAKLDLKHEEERLARINSLKAELEAGLASQEKKVAVATG